MNPRFFPAEWVYSVGIQTVTILTMASPWRDPRTGMFYLRRRVPARYAGIHGVPSGLIKWSLHTKDPKEARRVWPEALAKWNDMEREWERRVSVEAITPERANHIAAAWADAAAAGRVSLPATGDASDVFDLLDFPTTRTADAVRQVKAILVARMDEACRLAGITPKPETLPVLECVMMGVVRAAYLEADTKAAGLNGGPASEAGRRLRASLPEVPAVPGAAVEATPKPSKITFAAMFDNWRMTTSVKPRTITEAEYALGLLEKHLGHDDATAVTREALIAWRNSVKAAGLSNDTWNNRLSLIGQVFKRAHDDGMIPDNPTVNLRLPKAPRNSPLPFTDEEAARILVAARKETNAARRWAHWIMAFTGMRVGEVLQLAVADLHYEDGVHYFRITEAGEGKSVKTGDVRHVPIHSALIAEGLLDYAAGLPKAGPLFPDKRPDKHGLRGARGWKAVGQWVRETVGITDPTKVPNHSWRHRMEDELTAAAVDESIRDAILGHARQTTGGRYGTRGENLLRLAQALERVPMPRGVPPSAHRPSLPPRPEGATGSRPAQRETPGLAVNNNNL